MERDDLLDILEHPSPDRYGGHRSGSAELARALRMRPRLLLFVRETMMAVGGAGNPIPTVTALADDVADDVVSALA